jgi:hypothetical protein
MVLIIGKGITVLHVAIIGTVFQAQLGLGAIVLPLTHEAIVCPSFLHLRFTTRMSTMSIYIASQFHIVSYFYMYMRPRREHRRVSALLWTEIRIPCINKSAENRRFVQMAPDHLSPMVVLSKDT